MLRINHHRQWIAPARLGRLAMTRWKMTMIEPTLDDLLDDEIMTPVMRSAGVDAVQLKARLAEQARRLSDRGVAMPRPVARGACRSEALCCSA
jgi:hypothetical protein